MKRYPEMCLQLENDEDRKSLHSMETDRVCTYSLVDVTKMIDERRNAVYQENVTITISEKMKL